MKKNITFKRIFEQLKADLIGKDSYRGVTLSYAWISNQFGHFSLGFIPTLILFAVLKYFWLTNNPIIASIIVSVCWLLFEVYNFLGPLWKSKRSKSNLIYIKSDKEYQFVPDYKNVGFDTFTDVCFFIFGAFLCGCFLVKSGLNDVPNLYIPISFTIIFLLPIILFFLSKHWYVIKIFQQNANYPFQFRLSQFENEINEIDKKVIIDYKDRNNKGSHLLIFGGNSTGKTSLAIGLANELSIKKEACYYTTAIKLFTCFFENQDDLKDWHWHSCNYLVIDDINPGDPIKKDVITTTDFINFMDKINTNNKDQLSNRDILKSKNIIWVFGNDSDKRLQSIWTELICDELKVDQNKVSAIHL